LLFLLKKMAASSIVVNLSGDGQISAGADGEITVKNTNRLSSIVAGGSTAVSRGVWYFEVRCVDKCPLIGWAVAGFKKSLGNAGRNEAFYLDYSSGVINGCGRTNSVGRTYFNSGDIIGCKMDFDNKEISFSYNGEFLSSSMGRLSFASGGYIPVFEVKSRSSITLTLNETAFCAGLPDGALSYGDAAGGSSRPKDEELSKIFDNYVSTPGGDKCDGDQLQKLFEDVGSTSDLDPIVFVFLFFVDSKNRQWEVQRESFIKAFKAARCKNLKDISAVLKREKTKLDNHDTDDWKNYYSFLFHLLKGGSTKVNADNASAVWEILGFKSWKFFDAWTQFIARRQKEHEASVAKRPPTAKQIPPELIGLDVWESFPEFVKQFPTSFKGYDSDDLGFNSMFDDFVDEQ